MAKSKITIAENADLMAKSKDTAAETLSAELARLRKEGISVIDLSGEYPQLPTPGIVRNTCKRGVDKRREDSRINYKGSKEFRQTIAFWLDNRFKVSLDPGTQITAASGFQHSLMQLHSAVLKKSSYVLVPDPGCAAYENSIMFAGAMPYYYSMAKENDFLPDLEKLPADIVKKAQLMWISYPNNPTGAAADKDFYREVADFGRDNDIIIASNEALSEIYYGEPSPTLLQHGAENVVVFNSPAYRSSMPAYDAGWFAGDREIITKVMEFRRKFSISTPIFVHDAAAAAYADEGHVQTLRNEYSVKARMLSKALAAAGIDDCTPKAGCFIWQKTHGDMEPVEFAKMLLHKGVLVMPGSRLSSSSGKNHVRISLTESIESIKKAAELLRSMEF